MFLLPFAALVACRQTNKPALNASTTSHGRDDASRAVMQPAEEPATPPGNVRADALPPVPANEAVSTRELKTYVQQLNRLVRQLDPTGTLEKAHEREEAITKAGDATRLSLEKIDYEGINQAIVDLREVIEMLRSRVEGVPHDVGARVIEQIDAADLEEISAKIKNLINDANRKVQRIPVEQTEQTLNKLHETLGRLDRQLASVNIDVFNQGLVRTLEPATVLLWLCCGLAGTLTLYCIVRLFRLVWVRGPAGLPPKA